MTNYVSEEAGVTVRLELSENRYAVGETAVGTVHVVAMDKNIAVTRVYVMAVCGDESSSIHEYDRIEIAVTGGMKLRAKEELTFPFSYYVEPRKESLQQKQDEFSLFHITLQPVATLQHVSVTGQSVDLFVQEHPEAIESVTEQRPCPSTIIS